MIDIIAEAQALGITPLEYQQLLQEKKGQEAFIPDAFRSTEDQLAQKIRADKDAEKAAAIPEAAPVENTQVETNQTTTTEGTSSVSLDLSTPETPDVKAQIEANALGAEIDRILLLAEQEKFKADEVRNVLDGSGLDANEADSVLRTIPQDLQVAVARLAVLRRNQAKFKAPQVSTAGTFARNLVSAWVGDPYQDRIADAEATAAKLIENYKGADEIRQRLTKAISETNPAFVQNRMSLLEREAAKTAKEGTTTLLNNQEVVARRDAVIEDYKAANPELARGMTESELYIKGIAASIEQGRDNTERQLRISEGNLELSNDRFDQEKDRTEVTDRQTDRQIEVSEGRLKIAQDEAKEANSPEAKAIAATKVELAKEELEVARQKLSVAKAATRNDARKLEIEARGGFSTTPAQRARIQEKREVAVAKAKVTVAEVAAINRANVTRGRKAYTSPALTKLQAIANGQTELKGETPPVSSLVSGLVDVIGQAESSVDGYDAVVGTEGAGIKISEMTIKEVKAFQKTQKSKTGTPVGKYQFLDTTFNRLVKKLGISEDEVLTPELQDTMGLELMEEAGLSGYLASDRGQKAKDRFVDKLAGVWAGLPNSKGVSTYAGVGNNVATVELGLVYGALASIDEQLDQPDALDDKEVTVLIGQVNAEINNPTELSAKEVAQQSQQEKEDRVLNLSKLIGAAGNEEVFGAAKNNVSITKDGAFQGTRAEAVALLNDPDVLVKLGESSKLALDASNRNTNALNPALSAELPSSQRVGRDDLVKYSGRNGQVNEEGTLNRPLGLDNTIIGHSYYMGAVPVDSPSFGEEFTSKFPASKPPRVRDVMEQAMTARGSDTQLAAQDVVSYFQAIKRIKAGSPTFKFLRDKVDKDAILVIKNKYIGADKVINLNKDVGAIALELVRKKAIDEAFNSNNPADNFNRY